MGFFSGSLPRATGWAQGQSWDARTGVSLYISVSPPRERRGLGAFNVQGEPAPRRPLQSPAPVPLMRPVIKRKPRLSMRPRSPEWSQPSSSMASTVASSLSR